ncbi:hypothetical protein BDQ12DRAFT_480582 [Crucibulum laeve]|uniref:Uncharacterized protein n=1 Tax=Crucibulum laeve TaxID=68775 RepID=A0A5C3LK51_9AGAR|nr:hypothetical protein BDQ12DRAFT_480582 [Crucibulum laeve]
MYRDTYAKAPEFFIAMVQSRWRGSGNALAAESKCLHSVSFFVVSGQSKEAEDESIMQKISDGLQACVDAGLELNIHRNQHKAYWMLDASYDISDLHDLLMAR